MTRGFQRWHGYAELSKLQKRKRRLKEIELTVARNWSKCQMGVGVGVGVEQELERNRRYLEREFRSYARCSLLSELAADGICVARHKAQSQN